MVAKVLSIKGKGAPPVVEAGDNPLLKFMTDIAVKAHAEGRDKIIVISLRNGEDIDEYNHTINSLNIRSSEAIALLELTKNAFIKTME